MTTIKKVFLGGTCGENQWRKDWLADMEQRGISRDNFFDPQLPPGTWNEAAQKEEERQKKRAPYLLFYLASPMQASANPLPTVSMVEATMALYDDEHRVVVVFDDTGLSDGVTDDLKRFKQIYKLLRTRHPGAPIFSDVSEAKDWLELELKS